MEFKTEFFPILNELLYKNDSFIPKHIIRSNDLYLLNRYLSFYSPKVIDLANINNKFLAKLPLLVDCEYMYQIFDSIIPKLKKSRIKYISKVKSKKINNGAKLIDAYALKHKISKEKAWQLLYLSEQINQ